MICHIFYDERSFEISDLVLLVIIIIFMQIVSNILPILPTLSKCCLSHMCIQMVTRQPPPSPWFTRVLVNILVVIFKKMFMRSQAIKHVFNIKIGEILVLPKLNLHDAV